MPPAILAALLQLAIQLATTIEPAVAQALVALFGALTQWLTASPQPIQAQLLAEAQKIAQGLRTDHPGWSEEFRSAELREAIRVLVMNLTTVEPSATMVAALAALADPQSVIAAAEWTWPAPP